MARPLYYRELLRRELDRRLARNQRYSLRAFAGNLGVPVSTLSRALNGKRGISVSAGVRIADGLALEPRERRLFLESLAAPSAPAREGASSTGEVHDVSEETFRAIADWHHYAILELTYVKGFKSDPRWIATKLGLEPAVAQSAVERLIRLGLLAGDGTKLRKTKRTLWAHADAGTTPALRAYLRQSLEQALAAVDRLPPERRTTSAMTMPVDRAKLPLARRMIEEFAVELCRTLATGDMTDVYQLTIDFHSLVQGDPR